VRPVRVRKLASNEIDAAFAWYLKHSRSAAARFLEAVDDALAQIADAPDGFPVIRGRLRRVLLRRFPYAIYYKVYPGVISVVGVIHGHRHPHTWLRRH
jgi:plasmid stabilization system protein ParE